MAGRAYMPEAGTVEWETPAALFNAADEEWGSFDCDPCCQGTEHSAVTILKRGGTVYVPPPDMFAPPWALTSYAGTVMVNGLTMDWPEGATVFMNPPYGDDMPDWIKKAVREVACGRVRRVVGLIPVRSDTAVWQEYVVSEVDRGAGDTAQYLAAHPLCILVRFLGAGSRGMENRSRVRFGGKDTGAPFPCHVQRETGFPYARAGGHDDKVGPLQAA